MGEQGEPFNKSIPKTGWSEYLQWFLGERRRFVVREMSMVPTLMPGDTVLAEMGAVVRLGDIAIASHPTKPDVLLIKRVQEIFYDGGVYLISDNVKELSARDSRHFGVIHADQILGRVTSYLASASASEYSLH
ncbi:S26 family signal peptidase [Leptothoe spongobia]|uniref:S26 family signal peptidase n=1 Tax=Leptothoe spongobia TAU-MAC 1115 TaxID=1967444 RepID=A0A947DIZ7_9CYAN|nr:S26 family signal peptidase [Leptothoe spongobia]MBT9317885.1 S26 family signal peptidase [Leptothoe spongobia TAU-MAC 1115]